MKNPLDRNNDGRVNKGDFDALDKKQQKALLIGAAVIVAIVLIAIFK